MKPKNIEKFIRRIYAAYKRGDGSRYTKAVLATSTPEDAEVIIARLPPSVAREMHEYLAQKAKVRLARAREKQEKAKVLLALAKEEQQKAKVNRASLRVSLRLARANGTATTYLASLSPSERNAIATKEERAAAIELRKTAIMTGATCAALGCSRRELDRWDADGRLPHLFTKRIRFEKLTTCRFWALADVERAKQYVDAWRQQDRNARTHRKRAARRDNSQHAAATNKE
jgi:hypothetical protein